MHNNLLLGEKGFHRKDRIPLRAVPRSCTGPVSWTPTVLSITLEPQETVGISHSPKYYLAASPSTTGFTSGDLIESVSILVESATTGATTVESAATSP